MSTTSAVSADGRYVAFSSTSFNLVAGDSNGVRDVFVHDLLLNQTERVSVSSAGVQGSSNSFLPRISADGRFVTFESASADLDPPDANGVTDIFVRDRGTT